MARNLPLLLVQVPPRSPATAVEELRTELAGLLMDFPATQLVVYPEYHVFEVTGNPIERKQKYESLAESLDGPRVSGLKEIAREFGVWLIPGTVPERGENGEIFNTLIVLSPAGELVARYRKIFPWRPFEPWNPGNTFVVFDIPNVGRIGLAICYDIWFPEVARQLTWMGAELILYPAQTSTSDRAQELVLARATAIINQVFVVSVNGASPGGVGQSIIVDPEGLVRVQAPSEAPAILTDVINFDEVSRVRQYGTCGLNRTWSQFQPEDSAIDLPIYGGALNPNTWNPNSID